MNSDQIIFECMYAKSQPNQIIDLYEGCYFLIDESGNKTGVEGRIYLKFLPKFKIKFEGIINQIIDDFDRGYIMLKTNKFSANIVITKMKIGNDATYIWGNIRGNLKSDEITDQKMIDKIQFTVVNFLDTIGEKENIEYNEWIIKLYKRRDHRQIYAELEDRGGYSVTHVGVLEKKDGGSFRFDEGNRILEVFLQMLSFACGRMVGTVSIAGYDGNNVITQQYVSSVIATWESSRNWFPEFEGNILRDLFSGFMKKLQDDIWAKSLELCLEEYMVCSASVPYTVHIRSLYTALEMLAWNYFVADKKSMTEDEFKKLRKKHKNSREVSPQIKELLEIMLIPLHSEIVSNKIDLINKQIQERIKKTVQEKGYNHDKEVKMINEMMIRDAVDLFTDTRNSIVHSNKTVEIKGVIWEMHELGLWYLELVLLNLFSYKGVYSNRLKNYVIRKIKWKGIYDRVPWGNNA